ncbi:hypothetical protein DFH29DRAFT_1018774 [Suillus ampliporus]|nr:hypothetical protein DFH29DRAFT_1018774 [Suillus ampliporus]
MKLFLSVVCLFFCHTMCQVICQTITTHSFSDDTPRRASFNVMLLTYFFLPLGKHLSEVAVVSVLNYRADSHVLYIYQYKTIQLRCAKGVEDLARSSQHQVVKLLECGIGIWPTQLPRYTEVVMLADEYENTSVRMKEIDDPRPATYGNWQELVHPLGVQSLEDFVDASRAAVNEDGWTLVVLPTIFMGEERFQYYYVVPNKQDLNSKLSIVLNGKPTSKTHTERNCLLHRRITQEKTEATILSQSSAASMFWTLDQMNQIDTHLATIESLANNEIIEETGAVFCCRILYILRHHQFLNRHNQLKPALFETMRLSLTLPTSQSYYLRQKTKMFIVITWHTDFFLCAGNYRQCNGFHPRFFSHGVTTDFKPSSPLMIASLNYAGIVVASLLVLVLASYGPGLARLRPQ